MSGKNLFDINSLKKYEVDNNDLKTSVDNDKLLIIKKCFNIMHLVYLYMLH